MFARRARCEFVRWTVGRVNAQRQLSEIHTQMRAAHPSRADDYLPQCGASFVTLHRLQGIVACNGYAN
jgi:hypothetical protein